MTNEMNDLPIQLYERCVEILSQEQQIIPRNHQIVSAMTQQSESTIGLLLAQEVKGQWRVCGSSESTLSHFVFPKIPFFQAAVDQRTHAFVELSTDQAWASLDSTHLEKQRHAFLLPITGANGLPILFLLTHHQLEPWKSKVLPLVPVLARLTSQIANHPPVLEIEHSTTSAPSNAELLSLKSEELTKALEREQRLARLKDEFLSSMSHEMRTPLNAILGLTDVLMEGIYGDINKAQAEALSTISQSGHTLLELINDLIDYTRLAGNIIQIQKSPMNIEMIISSAIKNQLPYAANKEIEIVHQEQKGFPMIEGDPKRLKRCAVHLIQNAIKFSGPQTTVSISYELSQKNLTVHISDQGIGIHPDFLDSAFDLLRQEDGQLQRRYSGTGLGLSYVSKVLERHNGSIDLESVQGEGSQFSMRLPLNNQIS